MIQTVSLQLFTAESISPAISVEDFPMKCIIKIFNEHNIVDGNLRVVFSFDLFCGRFRLPSNRSFFLCPRFALQQNCSINLWYFYWLKTFFSDYATTSSILGNGRLKTEDCVANTKEKVPFKLIICWGFNYFMHI